MGPAAVVLLILSPTLFYPYGRDQSVFAYVGSVIARGGMPYLHAWDLKPPAIYLVYALLARLLPQGGFPLMAGVRVADLLLAGLTGVLLALLAGRLCRTDDAPGARQGIGMAAAAWYAAAYLHGTYWSLAQAEAWANPLALGAVLLCLRVLEDEAPPAPTLLAAGLLSGVTVLFKFTAVLPVLPFLVPAAVTGKGKVFRCLAVLAGAGLPLLVMGGWLARGHAWDAYLEIQRGFVVPYAELNAPDPWERITGVFDHTFGWLRGLWLPAVLALGGALRREEWRPGGRVLVLAALTAGLAAVWAQHKYFLYHWESALPLFALLAAVGMASLARVCSMPPRLAPVLGVALALAWSVGENGRTYRDAALYATGRLSQDAWLERFGEPGKPNFSFLADTWAAKYVREHTQPGDTILVWGFEPPVYLFSDRWPATRFFFNVPVTVRFAPGRWRREFLYEMRAHPPRLFLVLRNDAIPWASGRGDDSDTQLRDWPELDAWFRRHYRRVALIEDFAVYRLSAGRGNHGDAEARRR
jgi:hypothetical protein